MSAEADVLAANEAFYRAFRERDYEAMDQLWASQHVVACTHPASQVLHGRGPVMASWRAVLGAEDAPQIRCADASAFVMGSSAFVTCTEVVAGDDEGVGAELMATNVFVSEAGEWRLAHHHASGFTRVFARNTGSAWN